MFFAGFPGLLSLTTSWVRKRLGVGPGSLGFCFFFVVPWQMNHGDKGDYKRLWEGQQGAPRGMEGPSGKKNIHSFSKWWGTMGMTAGVKDDKDDGGHAEGWPEHQERWQGHREGHKIFICRQVDFGKHDRDDNRHWIGHWEHREWQKGCWNYCTEGMLGRTMMSTGRDNEATEKTLSMSRERQWACWDEVSLNLCLSKNRKFRLKVKWGKKDGLPTRMPGRKSKLSQDVLLYILKDVPRGNLSFLGKISSNLKIWKELKTFPAFGLRVHFLEHFV